MTGAAERAPDGAVRETVDRAREAQRAFAAGADQRAADQACLAIGWSLVKPENNRLLAQMSVDETGLGNTEDKVRKNRRKTLGLLRDIRGQPSVGVVRRRDDGIVEIARPVGVVAAVVPSTNPAATPTNKAINAVKGANAIVLAPSPKGAGVCVALVRLIREALASVGAPEDLVQALPPPPSRAATEGLMALADRVVATGSRNNIRAAYRSGTPAIGVGVGNVPVIVDETADLADAARKIRLSKTFDNATSCSSENSLVIVDRVYDDLLGLLAREGGRLLDAAGKARLQGRLWTDGGLDRGLVAKDFPVMAEAAGLEDRADGRFLMVEEDGVGPGHPFSGEKMSLVLALYRVPGFEEACGLTRRILEHQGAGHSVGIHTQVGERPLRLGLTLPTSRVMVNQAHCFANGGSFDNGMPFSLSMGCGSWGGDPISENLNFRHYLNTTRVAWPVPPDEPTLGEIFSGLWAATGETPPADERAV